MSGLHRFWYTLRPIFATIFSIILFAVFFFIFAQVFALLLGAIVVICCALYLRQYLYRVNPPPPSHKKSGRIIEASRWKKL